MTQLPYDITRCVSPTCSKRWRCARWQDVAAPSYTKRLRYADLTPEPMEECQAYIEWDSRGEVERMKEEWKDDDTRTD